MAVAMGTQAVIVFWVVLSALEKALSKNDFASGAQPARRDTQGAESEAVKLAGSIGSQHAGTPDHHARLGGATAEAGVSGGRIRASTCCGSRCRCRCASCCRMPLQKPLRMPVRMPRCLPRMARISATAPMPVRMPAGRAYGSSGARTRPPPRTPAPAPKPEDKSKTHSDVFCIAFGSFGK